MSESANGVEPPKSKLQVAWEMNLLPIHVGPVHWQVGTVSLPDGMEVGGLAFAVSGAMFSFALPKTPGEVFAAEVTNMFQGLTDLIVPLGGGGLILPN